MPEANEPKEGLKAQLELVCEDLWWSSESDYPVEVVWQSESGIAPIEIATDNDSLGSATQKILKWLDFWGEQNDIERVDVTEFFERATTPKSWHTKADKEQLNRLKQLKKLLTSELSHLQVYRCGDIEVTVYVLGYIDRILAGVRTVLIET